MVPNETYCYMNFPSNRVNIRDLHLSMITDNLYNAVPKLMVEFCHSLYETPLRTIHKVLSSQHMSSDIWHLLHFDYVIRNEGYTFCRCYLNPGMNRVKIRQSIVIVSVYAVVILE